MTQNDFFVEKVFGILIKSNVDLIRICSKLKSAKNYNLKTSQKRYSILGMLFEQREPEIMVHVTVSDLSH